jgi:vacuolar-type H+-ATPase subunit F/Vma7
LVGSSGNHAALKSLPECKVTAVSLSNKKSADPSVVAVPSQGGKIVSYLNFFRGYAAHLAPESESMIMRHLELHNLDYNIIFFDTSLLGRLAEKVRKAYPNIHIITFFHNVECVYALFYILINGLWYIPMFFSHLFNEARAVKFSDTLITFNERDKTVIEKIYKKRVDYTHSVWLDACSPRPEEDSLGISSPLEVLFVGSWFYANVAGIKWFIKKVLPGANIHLTIAGNRMERLKKYESAGLQVVGTTDDLDKLYSYCDCVVAPIFHGSGMKIKVADAFRHGKTVVGTPEAFTGYHITGRKEGYICKTAGEFKQAFMEIAGNQRQKTNKFALSYFESFLSKTCAINNLSEIIKNVC